MVRELIERQYGVTLSHGVGRAAVAVTGSDAPTAGPAGDRTGGVAGAGVVDGRVSRHPGAGPRGGGTDFLRGRGGGRSQSHAGTTWALQGQTPVVPATGKRFGLNLVSAVSPRGVLRFMVVDGRMTAVRFIEFLKRLLHEPDVPDLSHRRSAFHPPGARCAGLRAVDHTAACGCSSCRRTPRNSTPMSVVCRII